MLTIVGLGPAGLDLLPARNLAALRAAPRVILRTGRHPAAAELAAAGLRFETLDSLYDAAEDFAGLYPRLAEAVLAAAAAGPVAYAVPGHPLLGEESVRLVLAACRVRAVPVAVLAAPGFADAVAVTLAAAGEFPDLTEWQVADGAAADRVWWDPTRPTLVFQVDDAAVASRVKLALMGEYPDEHPVFVVRRAGDGDQEVLQVPLFQLDRPEAGDYDPLTSLYVPPLKPDERRPDFPDLVAVVARLRAPDGCPWDREQTYQSLKRFVLEEAYEVLEAIDADDPPTLCDELGDLLLQVVLLAQLAAEDGYFDVRDAAGAIVAKLIRRHPHVFGDVEAADSEAVRRNWDAIKRAEKPERESVLDGVPKELPALMKALEVSRRVVRVGFEWDTLEDVFAKLDEEVGELRAELAERDPARLAEEVGDLLFTVVNLARWLKVDPEEALRRMVERFAERFRGVERLAAAEGRDLADMRLAELDRLWERAKAGEGGAPTPAGGAAAATG
jgi:tetrapyrrole methylase family protein/MazG family protein